MSSHPCCYLVITRSLANCLAIGRAKYSSGDPVAIDYFAELVVGQRRCRETSGGFREATPLLIGVDNGVVAGGVWANRQC